VSGDGHAQSSDTTISLQPYTGLSEVAVNPAISYNSANILEIAAFQFTPSV